MKHPRIRVRKDRVTRIPSPPPRRSRDTARRHSVLLDRSGNVVKRCSVPQNVTFVLSVRDGHYYDQANPTTFVRRVGAQPDPADVNLFLSVPCPVQKCTPFPGFACGSCHVDPIHRSRIVAALKMFGKELVR